MGGSKSKIRIKIRIKIKRGKRLHMERPRDEGGEGSIHQARAIHWRDSAGNHSPRGAHGAPTSRLPGVREAARAQSRDQLSWRPNSIRAHGPTSRRPHLCPSLHCGEGCSGQLARAGWPGAFMDRCLPRSGATPKRKFQAMSSSTIRASCPSVSEEAIPLRL